jgi:hypothetical protein
MSSSWFSKQNIEETLPNKDPKASSKRQELRTLLAFTCFSHQFFERTLTCAFTLS